MTINPLPFIRNITSVFILPAMFLPGLLLNGCDSSEKNSVKNFSIQQKVQKFTSETTLKGQVSNKKGPIKSGEIKATDSTGKIVATSELKNDNHYVIKIPAGTVLPLTLSFFPDKNNVAAKDKLISVVIYSSMTNYDINELTTLIAKKAKALGGYTHTNMVLAADSTVGVPDANKTTTGFRGDPTKQYGGWH